MTPTKTPRPYRDAADNVPRDVHPGQVVADVPGEEAVLFVIGMRINRWRRVRSWWPVVTAMPRMLRELQDRPDLGLLGAESYWAGRRFVVMQHWRSAEDLGTFARDPGLTHAPAWAAFNRAVAGSGDVGIFHETYRVPASGIESLYANLPPVGLAAANGFLERSRGRRTTTHERLGSTVPDHD